jgi:hypothetical protein
MADRPLGYRTQTSVTSTAAPQTVYDTIADLRNHLDWSGERATSQTFKLLSMEAPEGPAAVGTTFSSSGAAEPGGAEREDFLGMHREDAEVVENLRQVTDRVRHRPHPLASRGFRPAGVRNVV